MKFLSTVSMLTVLHLTKSCYASNGFNDGNSSDGSRSATFQSIESDDEVTANMRTPSPTEDPATIPRTPSSEREAAAPASSNKNNRWGRPKPGPRHSSRALYNLMGEIMKRDAQESSSSTSDELQSKGPRQKSSSPKARAISKDQDPDAEAKRDLIRARLLQIKAYNNLLDEYEKENAVSKGAMEFLDELVPRVRIMVKNDLDCGSSFVKGTGLLVEFADEFDGKFAKAEFAKICESYSEAAKKLLDHIVGTKTARREFVRRTAVKAPQRGANLLKELTVKLQKIRTQLEHIGHYPVHNIQEGRDDDELDEV